jgi:hypothetical protein
MKKYLRVTEYVWMALSIICVCITAYYFITGSREDGVFGMVITLFAGVMYSMRRRFNRQVMRAQEMQNKEKK